MCPTLNLFTLFLKHCFIDIWKFTSQEKEWVWLEDQNTYEILKFFFYILTILAQNVRKIY